jgi:dCTP deaminase
MILSGEEILTRLGTDIVLDPFDPEQLNPNSYDLLLHDELLVYEEVVLDVKQPNRFRRIQIPQEGLILSPSQLYLGRTVERTETHRLVPMLEGRSSLARLGLFVHVSSGLGDVGFCGYWTLEMFAVQPVRIYPGIKICQVFYHEIAGEVREYQSDKYQHNHDIQPSLMYKEFGQSSEGKQLRLDFDRVAANAVEGELQKQA